MKHLDDQDVENLLRRAHLKPGPPGLKTGILEEVKTDSARRPRVLRVAAACVAVWGILLGADAIVSRAQSERMASFLDGREIPGPSKAEDRLFLAEINAVNGEADIFLKRMAAARAARRADPREFFDALERRKGWTEYEN